jgi:hypothetical protein
MLGYCWYWFFYTARLSTMFNFFPIYFSLKVLHFLFVWCIFHFPVCLSKPVIKFLTVCPKQFILVILILSFPLSRQSLRFCRNLLFKRFNPSIQIFFLLYVIFLKQSGSLYVLYPSVVSFISTNTDNSFLMPLLLPCMRLTHVGGFDLCVSILYSAVPFISSLITVAVA